MISRLLAACALIAAVAVLAWTVAPLFTPNSPHCEDSWPVTPTPAPGPPPAPPAGG